MDHYPVTRESPPKNELLKSDLLGVTFVTFREKTYSVTSPEALVARLDLAPHPEGGFYRETFRQPAPDGGRALSTAILFLLPDGGRSHWHRVDAAELWFWHAGRPLDLSIDDTRLILGPDVLAGHHPQALVPARAWQSAEATRGRALVSCVVSPGFDFAGFELAPPGWSPDDQRGDHTRT